MMVRCLPPLAWSVFAQVHPDQALPRPGQIGSRSDLERINANANRMARQFGPLPQLDVWLIWPSRAWCHDYAVTKRHDLLRDGWPSSALLLAQCVTGRGENHMVLVANGLVLDNLRADLLPQDETGYQWTLPIQSAVDPNRWEKWS